MFFILILKNSIIYTDRILRCGTQCLWKMYRASQEVNFDSLKQITGIGILCDVYIVIVFIICFYAIGEYRIGLKFNDEHVPDSPFKVYISPAVGDAHLLEVGQFPEGSIQADKPAQFMVRTNGAKGDLDAKVILLQI